MSDIRSTPRVLCADLIRLEWLDDAGNIQVFAGVLEDISPRGACLQVESPVPENMNAIIRHQDHWVMACRTAYCVFREIGYYVGVEFDSHSQWSAQHFQPEHLLDIGDLVSRTTAI